MIRVINGFQHVSTYSDDSYEYSDESESLDEDGLFDDISTPHDIYTDTDTEVSLVEISSSDERCRTINCPAG